jgi:hypothetical protein
MESLLFPVLAQASALPDTVLMRMVPPEANGFQHLIAVAQGGAVLLVYVLVIAAIWAVIRLRRSLEGARASLEGVGRDLRALADNANRISHSVAAVAASLERDVASVHETVEYANRRARHAVSVLADRVDEFNGALGIVQEDTQGAIFSALAALKGVRAGLAALRSGRRGRGGRRRDAADEAGVHADADEDAPIDLGERPRLRRRAPAKR